MARRRKISDKEGFGKVPKLDPGDEVPRTGKFRLDEGVRIKPYRRYGSSRFRAHPEKAPRLGKIRGIRTGVRRRRYR